MPVLPQTGWWIKMRDRFPAAAAGLVPLRALRSTFAGRVHAVTMEVGRDESLIDVGATIEGSVRLAFGSGEEFVGNWENLPAGIGDAGRRLLATARPFVGRLAKEETGDTVALETVRIGVHAANATYVGGSGVADLENGNSPLAPLWAAFSEMLGPLMVTLYRPTVAADLDQHHTGIARARRLWVRVPRP